MPRESVKPSAATSRPEDRREWLRIDERLFLDYRLVDESAHAPALDLPPVTKDMISALVNKPTADLIAREGETLDGSPLLPWISKIDWLLEMILASLATIHPGSVSTPRLTDVNISAGGLSFLSPRPFGIDALLALRVIIPPFTPIQTQARVIRAEPAAHGSAGFKIAVEFSTLAADDQEHIIRHIIRMQAEQLRARKAETEG
ncbi:PilZ domain-containing protein [Nitrospira sp. Nam80]